jgi:hypothetical protein
VLLACGGSTTQPDGGSDAAVDGTPVHDASADVVDAADASTSITFSGTTVVSPSAAPLAGVDVCVFQHMEIPCATSDPSGAFSLPLPMNSNTGLTLVLSGYASVLVPLTVAEADITGYEIGVPSASARMSMYTAFGATYPDTTNGLVMLAGTLEGQNELGLAGATGTLAPSSGTGPFYLDASGNPAPAATSTSTYSVVFFAGVSPGTYTGQLGPTTSFGCTPNFGGWPSAADTIGFPVAAGFETHVGLVCHP